MPRILEGRHVEGATCYHDNYDCRILQQIPSDLRIRGTGGMKLCEECAELAGPAEWTHALMGRSHPPTR